MMAGLETGRCLPRHHDGNCKPGSTSYHAGERLRQCARLNDPSCAEAVLVKPEVAEASAVATSGPFIEGVCPPPGLPPPFGLPSHGSLLHGSGKCKPCMWFWKPEGCGNGQDCGHCHLCPQSEIAMRRRSRRAQTHTGKPNRCPPQVALIPRPPLSSPQSPWSPSCSESDVITHCDSDAESLSSFGAHSASSRNYSSFSPQLPHRHRSTFLGCACPGPWSSSPGGSPPGAFLHERHNTMLLG